jgi:hypothetical protein
MVQSTAGPIVIQLINFPLNGSVFPHAAYC